MAALGADVFISEPMSGYSVDNIAPPAPAGVVYDVVDASIQLDWAPLNINDLGIYRVYRATSADMSDAVMIGESALNSYSDETVDFNQDGTYYYAIAGVDIHENEGDASEAVQVGVVGTDAAGQLPTEFALMQNYPNPFNPSTQIQFALPEAAAVTLIVYDLTGREVVRLTDGQTSAGYHTMTWNGLNAYGDVVPAGMYIYRLQAGEFSATKRMIYLQ